VIINLSLYLNARKELLFVPSISSPSLSPTFKVNEAVSSKASPSAPLHLNSHYNGKFPFCYSGKVVDTSSYLSPTSRWERYHKIYPPSADEIKTPSLKSCFRSQKSLPQMSKMPLPSLAEPATKTSSTCSASCRGKSETTFCPPCQHQALIQITVPSTQPPKAHHGRLQSLITITFITNTHQFAQSSYHFLHRKHVRTLHPPPQHAGHSRARPLTLHLQITHPPPNPFAPQLHQQPHFRHLSLRNNHAPPRHPPHGRPSNLPHLQLSLLLPMVPQHDIPRGTDAL
jgi:hypothetical protein